MINLKITMVGGEEFNIKNFAANSVPEFIKGILCRNQTQLNWYEIIVGTFIQVIHIESIKQLSNEELEKINNPTLDDRDEVVFDEDKDNQEIEESSESEITEEK